MKITIKELRTAINETLAEVGKKPAPKKKIAKKGPAKPQRFTAAMLMDRIVAGLRAAGLKPSSREKNFGARRTWLNFAQRQEHDAAVKTIDSALRKNGIESSQSKSSGGAELKFPGGYIIVTDERGRNSLGTDVVVTLFDGPRAHQEEMGMDTGDMGEPGRSGSEPL